MITLEFRNQPLGGLRIIKLDSVTKKPLEGVQFRITYSDGSFVADEGGKLSSNGLYMTDANGEILIRDIVGTLVVTEVKTIPGYTIDEATRSQTIVVNPDDLQTLIVYNVPAGGLQIIKSDEDTGERLGGVKFEIAKSMVKSSGPIPPTATASSASPTQRVAGIPSLSARRKTDTHSILRPSMHASRMARLRR